MEYITKGDVVSLNLTSLQVSELAKPFANMLDSIAKFYENPQVKKEFEEWHLKKFGRKPTVRETVLTEKEKK